MAYVSAHDFQQITIEKQKQHKELILQVQQLKTINASLQQEGMGTQGILKEPKNSIPKRFYGTQSKFGAFFNQILLVIQMHPSRYPHDASEWG